MQPQTKDFIELLCFMVRGTAGDELRGAKLKRVAAVARSIDVRVAAKSFPAMTHDEFHALCAAFARQSGDCATTQHAMSGARQSVVHAIQKDLHKINSSVPINGKLDAVTVDAINAVFGGWDDAPSSLRTGQLSKAQIHRNLPVVAKFLRRAITGATTFADVNTEGCC